MLKIEKDPVVDMNIHLVYNIRQDDTIQNLLEYVCDLIKMEWWAWKTSGMTAICCIRSAISVL